MKISLRNLGELKKAEFELGDLTIICGGNNTGKTYTTYALYGFLNKWGQTLLKRAHSMGLIPSRKDISTLLDEGFVDIDINIKEYGELQQEVIEKTLAQMCKKYTGDLPTILAALPEHFKNTQFKIRDLDTNHLNEKYKGKLRLFDEGVITISKAKKAKTLRVEMQDETKEKLKLLISGAPHGELRGEISWQIYYVLAQMIFRKNFPNPFIISTERTGVSIFRKELDFARNRIVEELMARGRDIDTFDILEKNYSPYPLPVRDNVDFIRNLDEIAKQSSFIAEKHNDILKYLESIVEGRYIIKNDQVYFSPHGNKNKLLMSESSGATRSLLILDYYLRHVAQEGDLLIIDEPELNLHPEKQRQIARLLARLVNIGIKVFITTHTDYIIREFNTLIMLNKKEARLKKIMSKENYKESELITENQIKAYFTFKRKQDGYTLKKAYIDEAGIDMKSFDKALDAMNRIQEDIVWGE